MLLIDKTIMVNVAKLSFFYNKKDWKYVTTSYPMPSYTF